MLTTKQYDFLNRLTNVASVAGSTTVASFGYSNNLANQRMTITNADGAYWVYTYDSLGQVTSGKKYWSDNTPVAGQQFEYTFDDIGNRKTAGWGGDDSGGNLDQGSYAVNNLNQYTTRDVPGTFQVIGSANSNATVSLLGLWGPGGIYGSDYAPTSRKGEYYRGKIFFGWNSSSPVIGTVTTVGVLSNGPNPDIVASSSGELFIPETPEHFTYDLDGNLVTDGRWTYTWDAENRVIQMVDWQSRLDFEYDWKGRRIRKKVWNNTTGTGTPVLDATFVYDGWNLLAEVNASHSAIRTYMWGLDLSGTMQGAGGVGALLTVNDASQGAHFVAMDGNGNVGGMVKASDGTLSAGYEYGPFGEVIRATGPMAKGNPFRFSTKYQDDETDLLYYGYRYYNASAGRWLSKDPIVELGFNPAGTSADNVRGAEVSQLTGMALRRDKNFKEALKPWLLREAARNGSQDFEMLPHVRPEELNTYRFTVNDGINQIDVNGLIGTPIFYACPSIKCGLYMCIGYFDFKNRFPRHPLDLYFCLDSMKKSMDWSCLTANKEYFDAACRGTLDCFKSFW